MDSATKLEKKLRIANERIAELTHDAFVAARDRDNLQEHGPAHKAREWKRAAEDLERVSTENNRLASRLEEERKRREMLAVCLGDPDQINKRRAASRWARITPEIQRELALAILEERELRSECEDCGGPCAVDGRDCLLCGHVQPPASDAQGPGIESGIARDLNAGRRA